MHKHIAMGVVLALSLVLGGCKDSQESLAKEAVGKVKKMASILKDVSDEASAKTAAAKIKTLNEEMKDVMERAKKLDKEQKLSPEERRRLDDKYSKELEDAGKEVQTQMRRIGQTNPKAAQALAEAMLSMPR